MRAGNSGGSRATRQHVGNGMCQQATSSIAFPRRAASKSTNFPLTPVDAPGTKLSGQTSPWSTTCGSSLRIQRSASIKSLRARLGSTPSAPQMFANAARGNGGTTGSRARVGARADAHPCKRPRASARSSKPCDAVTASAATRRSARVMPPRSSMTQIPDASSSPKTRGATPLWPIARAVGTFALDFTITVR